MPSSGLKAKGEGEPHIGMVFETIWGVTAPTVARQKRWFVLQDDERLHC